MNGPTRATLVAKKRLNNQPTFILEGAEHHSHGENKDLSILLLYTWLLYIKPVVITV